MQVGYKYVPRIGILRLIDEPSWCQRVIQSHYNIKLYNLSIGYLPRTFATSGNGLSNGYLREIIVNLKTSLHHVCMQLFRNLFCNTKLFSKQSFFSYYSAQWVRRKKMDFFRHENLDEGKPRKSQHILSVLYGFQIPCKITLIKSISWS